MKGDKIVHDVPSCGMEWTVKNNIAAMVDEGYNHEKVMHGGAQFLSPECMVCGIPTRIRLPWTYTEAHIREWKNGAHIQNVFPTLPAPIREIMKTGTHPDCWERAFAELD